MMDFSDQTTENLGRPPTAPPVMTTPGREQPFQPQKRRSVGRVLLIIVSFLAGIIVTFLGLFSYLLFFAQDAHPIASSPPSSSTAAILVQTKAPFMTAITQKNINASNSSLGQMQNVQVAFSHNGPMVITGDTQLNILGITTSRHLTLELQPSTVSCQLHMQVVHADLEGFPITAIVQGFEGQINSQMQLSTGLPPGFKYCVTDVHTESDGLYLTYSATPQ